MHGINGNGNGNGNGIYSQLQPFKTLKTALPAKTANINVAHQTLQFLCVYNSLNLYTRLYPIAKL
jgi:hypothetical protein